VLHVGDAHRFRRIGPLPAKDPERFRIVALGDSLTYGMGVPAEWTWPSVLASWLSEEARVEVLNMGVSGYASGDVLAKARELLPTLEPDLVLYGVCLNDFLTAREFEPLAWKFPLPWGVQAYFLKRTRVGDLVRHGYGALVIRLGLRPDFYADMADSPRWPALRARFASDVAELQQVVAEQGLPPVIALVLDQSPRTEGPGRDLAEAAEAALADAGIQVIPSRGFYERFDGSRLTVSRWERHPNEEAMLVYASLFRSALRDRPDLDPYR
jgi:lysophospholipase L1-like esterase